MLNILRFTSQYIYIYIYIKHIKSRYTKFTKKEIIFIM